MKLAGGYTADMLSNKVHSVLAVLILTPMHGRACYASSNGSFDAENVMLRTYMCGTWWHVRCRVKIRSRLQGR